MAGSDAGLALERELSKLQTFPTLAGHEGPVPSSPQPRYLHPHAQSYRRSPPQQRKWKNIGGRISRKALKLYDAQVGYTRTKLLSFPRFYPLSPQVLLYNTGWMQSRAPFPLTTVPPLPRPAWALEPGLPRSTGICNNEHKYAPSRRQRPQPPTSPTWLPPFRSSPISQPPRCPHPMPQTPNQDSIPATTGIGLREPPK